MFSLIQANPAPAFVVDEELNVAVWSVGMREATMFRPEVGAPLSSLPHASVERSTQVHQVLSRVMRGDPKTGVGPQPEGEGTALALNLTSPLGGVLLTMYAERFGSYIAVVGNEIDSSLAVR